MRRIHACLNSLLILLLLVQSCVADLATDIQGILADPLLSDATVGIEIVRLGQQPADARIVYEKNAHLPLIPASNMKLLTTAAALHVLTPEFRFRTLLVQHGDDLIIWGDGDPTLADAKLMDKIGWSQTAVFDDWIAQLHKRQITTVRDLLIDDSIFDQEFHHPRWTKHQFEPWAGQIGGLNFNTNVFDITVHERKGRTADYTLRPSTRYAQVDQITCVGGRINNVILERQPGTNQISIRGTVNGACQVAITAHDPSMYAGTVFAEMLHAKGIQLARQVRRDRTTRRAYSLANPSQQADWRILCRFETPIEAVVMRTCKDSINMYAEALCKRMGAAASREGGSWAGGTAVMAQFLRQLGVPETEHTLDDGSGLSRDNRLSANALIRVLLHSFYAPSRAAFMNALPVGGVDGTLRGRFKDPALRERVFAKTGFIANVSTLSGYVHGGDNRWYAFSILINGIPDFSNSSIKPLQEKIVKAIHDNSD